MNWKNWNWHMWLAIVVAVLTLAAKGTVALPVGVPEAWGQYVTSWSNFLLTIYGVVAPVLVGASNSNVATFATKMARAGRPVAVLFLGLFLIQGASIALICVKAYARW